MPGRLTILSSRSHDGTSRRNRPLAALDPDQVAIDERSAADVLAFVQELAAKLRYFRDAGDEVREDGTWEAFAGHDDVSIADMVAYLADPERFAGDSDRARWLGRPHFALLLAFVELLGHAREQLNELPRRHLDYFYRDVLQMQPQPAEPDRAAVVFRLASRVPELRLVAGTELHAGRDSSGVLRIYVTERDVVINRARVAALRSVHVDRRLTGIPDVRKDRDLTTSEVFERMLQLALGAPRPGDPVPPWHGAGIDRVFFAGLGQPLDFAADSLFLEHHELGELMRLVRRRDAGREWVVINALLGVENPTDPRDFMGNLESRVGVLDFKSDGLPQVSNVDDLYRHRTDSDVRTYIETWLEVIGYDNFVALMQLKVQVVDAEWAAINRLLERVGRRKRGQDFWTFPSEGFDPTGFVANLTEALGGALPSGWPWSTGGIYQYEERVRDLEAHLAMRVERIRRLVDLAGIINETGPGARLGWSEMDRILADAHREHVHAARRKVLAGVRGEGDDTGAFDAVVTFVLGQAPGAQADTAQGQISWDIARPRLAGYLDAGQLAVLDGFRAELVTAGALRRFDWPDVYRVLELAQRYVEAMPEPVARTIAWHNLYAFEDARAQRGGGDQSLRWKTFGRRPVADKEHPPAATLGWILRSPMLALSQGTRTLTVTLGFTAESFDLPSFLDGLGLQGADDSSLGLGAALTGAWVIEASTAKGWVELALESATLATGAAGDDYWSVRDATRQGNANRPALQLTVVADATCDSIAPLPGMDEPVLRMLLRQRWDDEAKEWTTLLGPFAPLKLAAVHLGVHVRGLTGLTLQQDERVLDPKKPFEPFGSRPAAGSRLYLGHPELVRARLDMVHFDIEWMGLPKDLAAHYRNYPGITGAGSFKMRMALVDRSLELELKKDLPLFEQSGDKRSLEVANVPETLQTASPGFAYTRRLDLAADGDLRDASRYLLWELAAPDFGHAIYPSLAAGKARELAVAIAKDPTKVTPDTYQVNAPYTPEIKKLSASYRTSLELDLSPSPGGAPPDSAGADCLLHVHPFGVAPVDQATPFLLPGTDQAGELYIGLADLDVTSGSPRHLSLLVQLAEGTSDPDVEPAPVSWSCLDRDRWQPVEVRHDSTRGLINSGIVELVLPPVAPSTLLPGDLYWLRVAIAGSPASVCDTVDIRAQAVMVRFEDRDNAADHYEQPLPAGTIKRLVDADARIAAVEQPFASFTGKPAEGGELFYTRISERLRHKQRALTPWDYERLVLERFAQVYKVKCVPAGVTGEPGRVDVIVIPDIRHGQVGDVLAPKAPANLLADIQEYLSERAPQEARIRVQNPRYVPVSVRLGVRFVPGIDEPFAKKQLAEDLIRFLSPWAYDEGAELMIGGTIYANSILDFVDRCDYVDYVAELKLFRGRENGSFAPQNVDGDHVPAERPDEVLVAAREHQIDVISELGYRQASFIGINYMKIGLDFVIG